MAPVWEDSDTASEESNEDSPFPNIHGTRVISELQVKHQPVSKQENPSVSLEQQPASKADIQNLLKEMQALFAADIALVREDLAGITARLQTLEDSGAMQAG
ncbi:Hypothetical predicted protein [Pelobates cultripes]|uniref:Heat shock factor binding protein 1 n=1 Tax=Pelobates cultripes TaxID=61616 RepID=A0AAD1R597_PELCU|nr:Hypothetical predicted protein [Pelobates cultripes]